MTTAEALKILETRKLRTFSTKELKEIGRPIINTAKKRVRAIEQKDLVHSPAYQGYVIMKGMTGSLAGNNINKLRHEIFEAVQFLKAKTSTIKGIKEADKLLHEIIGENYKSKEAKDIIWETYEIIKNEMPQALQKFNYREVVERISNAYDDYNYLEPRELVDIAMDNLGYTNYNGTWLTKEQYEETSEWDDIW